VLLTKVENREARRNCQLGYKFGKDRPGSKYVQNMFAEKTRKLKAAHKKIKELQDQVKMISNHERICLLKPS
jgi:hypothetical protein